MYKMGVADKPWDKFTPAWGPSEDLLLEPAPVQEQLEADWAAVRGREPIDQDIPHVSEERLREFVLGVLDGTLYTSNQVRREQDIPLVFLPVAFGGFKDWTEDALKKVGVLYAPMSAALPRSINGYPMFTEVRVLHRDDWARASKAIHRELSRREKLEI